MTFTIPRDDFETYSRLPDRAKQDLQLLLSALTIVHQAKTVKEGCKHAASRMRGVRGMSEANLKRRYQAYKRSGGDWRELVNRALLGGTTTATLVTKRTALPEAFVEHWRMLGESNARKWKPAHRALIRDWRQGLPIPGYGTWQEWFLREFPTRTLPILCPEDLPRGWGYENLMRHVSSKAEQAAARRGVAAAMEHLPTLMIDTTKLKPLQVIVFDDVRTDFLVHVPEANEVCELWGLVAMDLATRRIIRFGLRPRLTRDDGTKEGLLRRDMQALVSGILRDHGFPKDDHGMTLVVENAAAAITPAFEAALLQTTEGKVTVQRTSMITGQVFMDGFPDGNRGNYKGKAWLESYFNLLHNELASLPGQTGASYQLKPASLEGRRKEAMQLLKKGAHLPPALRMELRVPFMSLAEARVSMEDAFRRIDARTQHKLTGFREVTEWRLPSTEQWRPWQELPTLDPSLASSIETRSRLESPLERWHTIFQPQDYVCLPEAALPALLAEHKLITYHGPKKFGFQLGKKTFHFWRPGLEEQLQEGAQYLAWFDSTQLDAIHLTDPQGRYLDTVPARHGVAWGDRQELSRQIAEKKRTLNDTANRVRQRHFTEESAQARLDDLSHNTRVLEQGAEPLPETAPATQAIQPNKPKPSTIDVAAEILRKESTRGDSTPDAADDDLDWSDF